MKLLEAIGAIAKEDKDKAGSSNFQEEVIAPTDRAHDDEAAALEDTAETESEILGDQLHTDGSSILSAISKVRFCHFNFIRFLNVP